MKKDQIFPFDWLVLPLAGLLILLTAWQALSYATLHKGPRGAMVADIPSPYQTIKVSWLYISHPWEKRGEMDMGILSFTWLSLKLVAKGYTIALLLGTPLGFLLGTSRVFTKMFDPVIQLVRPVSPLAWLPLGAMIFTAVKRSYPGVDVLEWASIFTIALCAMWPTVLNTAVGVRAIPQDYLNVARVLRLSKQRTLFRILIPATLPYMFTGFRLSLGIAWLVIVAAEMLSGVAGIGGFLNQEYQSLVAEHIILCIIVIGVIGYAMDRIMSLIEKILVERKLSLPLPRSFFRRNAIAPAQPLQPAAAPVLSE